MAPTSLDHGLARAIALYNAGSRREAGALCRELLQRDPGHPAVHQLLAVLALDDKDFEVATQHAARSLSPRPDHLPSLRLAARAWYEVGRIRQERSDAQGALEALERAVAHAQDLAPAWFALALVHEDLGQLDNARASLERLLKLEPGNPEALVNLGLLLQQAGDIDAAMQRYALAYAQRPDTIGRIANALASLPTGRLWLRLDDLKAELAGLRPASGA